MKEIWKPVRLYNMYNYDGSWKYEVSNLGRVRRAGYWGYKRRRYHEPFVLKQYFDRRGYLKVGLGDGPKSHTIRVHRLVATAFVDRPEGADTVIYKDGNKTNNKARNLKWASSSGESLYVRSSSKAVRQYTLDGKLVAEWRSASVAKREGGFDNRTISSCCHRKPCHKTYKGFIWRFVTDDEFCSKAAG